MSNISIKMEVVMFNIFRVFKKFLEQKREIKDLRFKIDALKFELKETLSITEKYIPLMRTKDKVQLLILRRNLWTKS